MATWEEVHNPNFKVAQMNHFKNYASLNRNFISTKIYIEQTQTIGITSKSGRYGGTYAHPQPYKRRLPFAAEADMINEIVFGFTAKQWRINNPTAPTDRNQRDFARVLDLVTLNCLEVIDAMLIQWDVDSLEERRKFIQDTYDFIYPIDVVA